VLTDDLLEAGRDIAASRMEVFVRSRHDGADYVQPVENPQPQSGPGPLRTTIVIDPRQARAGRSVTRFSDLVAQVTYAGWNFGTSVRIDPALLASADLPERTIGRRAFTVATRGTNRLFLKARRLPPVTQPVLDKAQPLLRTRVVRKARRIAGRIRRGLLRVIR
jgi:hypothetical protein